MAIYAVIKTGGKQYRVAPGDIVKVEKLTGAPGATVEISEVYMLANAQDITVGNPTIANARVVAEVIDAGRRKKIIIFKQKRRKGYRRTIGHRQYFTTLRINEIALGDNVYKADVTVARAPEAIDATPTQPSSTKDDRSKASATVPAPKAPSPKATAPVKPESVAQADRTSGAVPHLRDRDTPAPRETITPMAPPHDTPPESRIEPAKIATAAPPVSETDNARIADTALPAEPSAREEQKQPSKIEIPPIRQPEATEAPARHKHWYWLIAVIALLAAIGFFLFGKHGDRTPENAVPVSAQPQETAPPKAKQTVRDVKIKKPAVGSTPSAPVQPPD